MWTGRRRMVIETYVFQGNRNEVVPAGVLKLIVNEGVEELPSMLLRKNSRYLQEVVLPNGLKYIRSGVFGRCQMSEISICSTVQLIGKSAFICCARLEKVQFECSTTSPQMLQKVEEEAFHGCKKLSRIKLPASVSFVGPSAFIFCYGLMEANLSKSSITKVEQGTFLKCSSLQTVSLPNTVREIGDNAFYGCSKLITLIVPLDSHSIKIGRRSFDGCSRIVNLVLSKGSTTKKDSFRRCELLKRQYGEDSSHIVNGLIKRFENHCIHRICYDHSTVTLEDLRRCIADEKKNDSLVDEFGMTPLHVLFSTAEPSVELLDVLLDRLPHQMLKWKDVNDKRPTDYLINNWIDGTKGLLERTFQKWAIDRLVRWGASSWAEAMQSKMQDILATDDKEERTALCSGAFSLLEHYEKVEATSLLEMVMWKQKFKSGRAIGGAKRQALDREECRCLSGSDTVIPHVAAFLGIPRTASG